MQQGTRMQFEERLDHYVKAFYPIIYINHLDFYTVDSLIKEIAEKDTAIHEYNEAGHHVDFFNKNKIGAMPGSDSLDGFLEAFDRNDKQKAFLVLKDVHSRFRPGSADAAIIARLKSIAERTMFREGVYVIIFLVCAEQIIPPELEKMITVFDIPLPDDKEISKIISDYTTGYSITIEEKDSRELVASFKGFSRFEIWRILNLAYQRSGQISKNDKQLILKEKEQTIKKSGILEVFSFNENLDNIGGLNNLKKYLRGKSEIVSKLDEAREFGVDVPRGILIVGMPGCGKSLTAKATAAEFKVPLLRLDIGKLMGKYIGESENNLRLALRTSEAVAPCVLWIDEIEKAFAGIGGQGGGSDITTRLFGQFLTWLQEKESSVYVVATSNDISTLPPEFLRKGRFDELFLVELPNDEERRCIFEIHLKKRGKLTKQVDVLKLLKPTEGYSGADIESVVREAVEMAFLSENQSVTTEKLEKVIENTKSISDTLKEKIEEMKKIYEKYDFKQASGEDSGADRQNESVVRETVEEALSAAWPFPMKVTEKLKKVTENTKSLNPAAAWPFPKKR